MLPDFCNLKIYYFYANVCESESSLKSNWRCQNESSKLCFSIFSLISVVRFFLVIFSWLSKTAVKRGLCCYKLIGFCSMFLIFLFFFFQYSLFCQLLCLFVCCHSTGTLLLVFWGTTEDALCADSCSYFCKLNCKHFTLLFPAVSIAGNDFSAEIIQLQLPKCWILSVILIFGVFITAVPRNTCNST